ncbi:MAG: dihydrofolate reductase [Candidatus Phytoplasma pruni]|uniref:dihydrofolate reductase n=1 Tax=Poinsettia branch-inducing phytoplasma TaxID=138647 RepID=UPI000382B404|nr:dihydrofolate reductase [Poinsettia branch-inducing phytoplasma]WEK82246.1 MAG: dihydrofolate reductase [Candidatus Phytoplasma pruni]
MISLITALDSNFLIGNKNSLPWHYPKDLIFFKKKTFQKKVLMGWNTYLSLKQYYRNKSLPFATAYIASNSQQGNLSDGIIVNDLIAFLKKYQNSQENIFIIGGSQIYAQSLPYADVLYITHILKRYQGDSFFPYVDLTQYQLIEKDIQEELIFATYQKGGKVK